MPESEAVGLSDLRRAGGVGVGQNLVGVDVWLKYPIVVAVAACSLVACTSSSGTSTPKTSDSSGASGASTGAVGGTGATPSGTPDVLGANLTARLSPFCTKLVAAGQRLVSAQSTLYSGGSGSSSAITTVVGELKALEKGAPSDIRSALTDMIGAFQDTENVLHHPTSQNQSQLASLGVKLANDGQKISTYVATKCS